MAGSHAGRGFWRGWLDRIRPSRSARHGDGSRDFTVPRTPMRHSRTVGTKLGTAWERHDDPHPEEPGTNS